MHSCQKRAEEAIVSIILRVCFLPSATVNFILRACIIWLALDVNTCYEAIFFGTHYPTMTSLCHWKTSPDRLQFTRNDGVGAAQGAASVLSDVHNFTVHYVCVQKFVDHAYDTSEPLHNSMPHTTYSCFQIWQFLQPSLYQCFLIFHIHQATEQGIRYNFLN